MKRFDWPRPALLIGYVLSTRVETSIYQTITTYGFSFLSHPIVIILLVLTVISIIAAIRYKPNTSEITDHGVHACRNLAPQSLFFAAVFILALIVFWDGLGWDILTGVYPMFAGGLCLLFMIPMGIEMYRTKTSAIVFYDSERDGIEGAVERRSNEYYLMWLLGMLAVSALAGFVVGIGSFIYIFVRLKARVSHFICAIYAGVFVLLLGTLSYFMTLQYPEGILQSYVTLPWPLQ
jgi:putative tricarboxylic transport membrane protein